MFHRLIFLILWVLLFACQGPATKEVAAVSGNEPNPKSIPALDSLFDQYVQDKKVSGGVALVTKGDDWIYHQAFGMKDIEQGIKQSKEDLFRIASMTKPITAVAAIMLWEEGKFQLDDPLSKYLPQFANPQILDKVLQEDSTFTSHPAEKEITIRQLFTQSSGIDYGFDDPTISAIYAKADITEGFEERSILLSENVEKIAQLPLAHEPGARYTYGLNTDVLGRLIEIWSDQPLDVFFQKRIFEPLGMQDTHFYLPEDKYDRLTKVYMSSPDGAVPTDYPLIHYPIQGAKTYLSGGADLSCTTYDYYLFCRMMLNGGILNGARILKEETVQLMISTHLETGDNDMGLGFGLLSAKTESTLPRSVGSYTWGGFFTTTFWIDPQEELIAILMLQMYPFEDWDIQSKFEAHLYDFSR